MTKKQFFQMLYRRGVPVMLIGIITGLTVGVVVTFFALAAETLAERSWDLFEAIRQHPAYVPLLFLVLLTGAFMVGVLTYLLPALGSNGVPQTEGISRGILKVKWYQMLPAMAATSLISIFMGLNAGSEGPCMLIGGMCGDGVGRLFNGTDMERRYQITGGACAGVAVAANAPLTGIVFALEEAHRRFTPSILICSFSAVISAIITRNLLYEALGLTVGSSLVGFKLAMMPAKAYLYVALAALVSGIVGVCLVRLVKLSGKLMRKITAWKGILKYVIPFVFAGVAGLITVYATGGGHSLVNMLGTDGGAKEMALRSIFGSPIAVTLLAVIILRVVALTLNIGAGVPSGIFVPIIALGALIGSLMSRLCILMGMDKIFVDSVVLICMAAMFAATVKAPLTAIIFVVEFTWQTTLLLPVVLGTFIGYAASEIAGNKPLYDLLLEELAERITPSSLHHEYRTYIEEGSSAAGQSIRDVLWDEGVMICAIERDGAQLLPTSDTALQAGDKLTLQADVVDIEEFEQKVEQIVKPQDHKLKFTLAKRMKLHAETISKEDGDSASATDASADASLPSIGDDAHESPLDQEVSAANDIVAPSQDSTSAEPTPLKQSEKDNGADNHNAKEEEDPK